MPWPQSSTSSRNALSQVTDTSPRQNTDATRGGSGVRACPKTLAMLLQPTFEDDVPTTIHAVDINNTLSRSKRLVRQFIGPFIIGIKCSVRQSEDGLRSFALFHLNASRPERNPSFPPSLSRAQVFLKSTKGLRIRHFLKHYHVPKTLASPQAFLKPFPVNSQHQLLKTPRFANGSTA